MDVIEKLKDSEVVDKLMDSDVAVKLKDVVDGAVDKGRTAVGDNAEKITSVIDTVTSVADSRTGGKYTEQITKLNTTAKNGVSSIGTPSKPAIADTEILGAS